MINDRDKKEMREDGLSESRRAAFARAEASKPEIRPSLDAYILFLTAAQQIVPFQRRRKVFRGEKNIL